MRATSAGSCPGAPGLMPPGASPYSPFVHVTTTVLRPSSAYRARIPPVLDDSSSGCAWTAMSVGPSDIAFTPSSSGHGGPQDTTRGLRDRAPPSRCDLGLSLMGRDDVEPEGVG